ncbi:helix-turn-helix domain-containing protein [Paenibacillus sp. EC2-1]|uniref:helix-turn-helix domain-containing protein n=1 Tax=Paenibacillus sp. EC2-1 TaxID=3388665 RepID=UPI003BEEE7FC
MRKRNVRSVSPTVIIQRPTYHTPSVVEVVERQQPIDQQGMLMQLAQMITQQQVQSPEPPVQTFDVKEAAEYLRVSAWSIYDLIRTKSIPFFKVKNRYFFRRYELDKWISENTNDCSGR